GIVDTLGVVASPVASQGSVFTVGDIAVMFAALRNGAFTDFSALADSLSAMLPNLDATTIARAIRDDIREDAVGDAMLPRARARLIVELGKRAHVPYDLLAADEPANPTIDPVQLGLIMQPMVTGLLRNARQPEASATITQALRSDLPCTLTDDENFILDVDAAVSGKGVERLVEYFEEVGIVGDKFARRLAAVNAGLAYLKLAWSLFAFEMKVLIEPGELIRTKNRTPGGPMEVAAEGKLDLGNAQWVNCVRPALTKFGLDFSLFNDGPLKGAEVTFEGVDFGAGSPGGNFVEFASPPILKAQADDAGKAKTNLQGSAQRKILPENSDRVSKTATIHITYRLKTANLKTDLVDALGGLPSLPAEMAFRLGWGFGRTFALPVIDWRDPCDTSTAGGAALRNAPQATNVCSDTWVGTTTTDFGEGSMYRAGTRFVAEATFTVKERIGEVVIYEPNGTLRHIFEACEPVVPESTEILPELNYLRIDYSVDPPTFMTAASTVWTADVTYCGQGDIFATFPLQLGLAWIGASGTISIDPADGQTRVIEGTKNDFGLVQTYRFTN
ncbi:MAG: hypothetical protein H7Z43_13235, partial [Clostridia bacterium]|nr:hypothetical protein [Deltaproteobacteria bacterium]